MKSFRPRSLIFAAALLVLAPTVGRAAPAKPDSATTAALKKITDRYALTKTRIAALLEQRMDPPPLPASLPNPFYHSPNIPIVETAPGPTPDVVAPAGPDSSDADTLARFAATMKIGGLVERNGQPHLMVNATLCKAGDVIPAGSRDNKVYIQILRITPEEVVLGLNQFEQTVKLRK
ncbi:MAG: hypothetical protein JWQ62_911 [Lacunisphaera sp.]|nr:hypothetical protein [Lacunisphaera sp.]